MKRGILLTYAFVSRTIAKDNDIFLALVPLFRPIIEQMANNVFDPKRFCRLVNEFYGLSMTTDVANEFIPRFRRLGLLTTQGEHLQKGSYLCVIPEKSEPELTNEREAERILSDVIGKFRAYVEAFPTLLSFDLDDDALIEMLSDWLVKSDPAVRQAEFILGEDNDVESGNADKDLKRFRRESDYLCARFTEDLRKADPDLFEEMANISAGSLIGEVVLDLKAPPSAGLKAQDLTVFLDAPFMMDVLELTGTERKENSQYIFNKLKSIGASLQMFSHSIAEVTDNLRAVLANPPPLRTGPTADALRKTEVSELYARTVLNDVRGFVEQRGVAVLDEKTAIPVNELPYFDDEDIREFSNSLVSWHKEVARDRDTKSIAYVMRRRKGHRSPDLFRSRYVLLTHNPALARFARDYCVNEGYLYSEHVGPAVHQRRFAALIWLTLGTDERISLSKRQLIANCATAVRSRSGVLQGMRATLLEVKPELKDQFDALLTRPRSVQLAMDLTLGVAEVVGPDNIEQVFELVKASAAEEEREKFKTELGKARERFGETITAKDLELKKIGEALLRSTSDLEDHIRAQKRTFAQLVLRAHRFCRRTLLVAKIALSTAIAFAVATTSAVFGASTGIVITAVVLISAVTIIPLWTRTVSALSNAEEKFEAWICERKLKQLLTLTQQEHLRLYTDVSWCNPPKITWHGTYEGQTKFDGKLL